MKMNGMMFCMSCMRFSNARTTRARAQESANRGWARPVFTIVCDRGRPRPQKWVKRLMAGDAFYAPPGHVPVSHEPGTEIVPSSPSADLKKTEETLMRN